MFASRYLLPVEILLGVIMIGWGLAGWLGAGSLVRQLTEVDAAVQWGVSLTMVGGFQLWVAGVEFAFGRRWSNSILLTTTSLRCVAQFFSMCVWVYVISVILSLQMERTAISLLTQVPIAFVFTAWAFYGNMKVRTLLDPKIQTTDLQRTIMMERKKLAGML